MIHVLEDQVAKGNPEIDEDLVKRLKAFNDVYWEKFIGPHAERKEDGFNCIIHNDSWCNNIMFK